LKIGGGYSLKAFCVGFLDAFTLAEILVTIGVIGVVAAMTIPGLITKYQQISAAQKLKRTYSIIMNAEKLSVIDNGEVSLWDTNITTASHPVYGLDFYKKYYAPYIKGYVEKRQRYKMYNLSGAEITPHNAQNMVKYSDGSCMTFFSNNQFDIWIYDVNCSLPPNVLGKDIWDIAELYWFWVVDRDWGKFGNGLTRAQIPFYKNKIDQDITMRESYVNSCKTHTYSGGAPSKCFAVFVADGWKWSKDLHW